MYAAPIVDVSTQAQALLPALRARAESVDNLRRIPDETIAEIRSSGLISLQQPRRFGGGGGSAVASVVISRELASACVSTGWVHGVYCGSLVFLAHFPVDSQEEVYCDPDALVSSVVKASRADITETRDGFRLDNVEGNYCSGVDHCSWVLVGASAGGERMFFLLPRDDVEIIDDWHSTGMRGTGSKTIRAHDAFVPSNRAVRYESMLDATSPGAIALDEPFYRQRVDAVTPYSLVGNSLGGAFAALDTFADDLARKLAPLDPTAIASQSAVLARLGHAATALETMYATMIESASRVDASVDHLISITDLTRLIAQRSYAVQTTRRVVNDLFELGGGSALYERVPLQRWWRDVNGAANHIGAAWDPAMTSVGRSLIEARMGPAQQS